MIDSFSRNLEHLDFYNFSVILNWPICCQIVQYCSPKFFMLYITEGCRKRKLPKFGRFAMVMVPNRFFYWDGNIWAISAKFPMNN